MPSERLSKHEILGKSGIKSLFTKGRCLRGHSFDIVCVAHDDNTLNLFAERRLGIIISKKVVRYAWRRNQLRRLYREVFRRNKQFFPNAHDFLFIQKSLPTVLSYIMLLDEITSMLKKDMERS